MSENRLRQGRKVGRTLYEQSGDAPSDTDPIIGMVDSAELAAEIVAAVNAHRDAARLTAELRDRIADAVGTTLTTRIGAVAADIHTDAVADTVTALIGPEVTRVALELTSGYELTYRQQQSELMDADERAADLSAAVWVHPGIKGGAPCIGGTRIPVDQIAGLMADVDAEDIGEYYPNVTPEGAIAAEQFAQRFIDRDDLNDGGETELLATELAEERTAHQAALALIRDLADDEPCWYDHHGYCQAHGWFETDPPCPHGRARQLAGEGQ